jgi:hypothetical protein
MYKGYILCDRLPPFRRPTPALISFFRQIPAQQHHHWVIRNLRWDLAYPEEHSSKSTCTSLRILHVCDIPRLKNHSGLKGNGLEKQYRPAGPIQFPFEDCFQPTQRPMLYSHRLPR